MKIIFILAGEPEEVKESSIPEAVPKSVPEEVVAVAPRFTRLLADVLAADGECVKFECAVEGKPKPSIRWCQNNKDVVPSDRIKVDFINLNASYHQIFCSLN